MATTPDFVDVRLTKPFIEQTIRVLHMIAPMGDSDRADFDGVMGYFENAYKVFRLREDAARIEQALKAAR